ncbi:hypothetical protein CP960_00820 [Malaciobacter halophilus]|uniref:FecR protein domain-containing protein n=1 Tax=Malaciobacter halophilus TaxID=197482 RepID=A0A2N1J693_9BACT|nr:FecR domain-containing protein [Malaciobacter halophilus]AXH08803.1 sigma factor regulatory protein, FecR family [Malaciobacter halophilus]PKI82034.1 hypothetical protein CP960_00820 [Malaciobacter halophilus]
MKSNEKIIEEAINWLNLEQEGLNNSEQQRFNLWIKELENKKEYENIKFLRNSFKQIPSSYTKKLTDEVDKEIKREKLFRSFKPLLAAAALLIILYFSVYTKFMPIYTKDYSTKHKILKNIILPDNSIVNLDVNTKLKVTYFKDSRKIKLLKGRAFFNVKKDKNRAFFVENLDTQIKVIGTMFEVSSTESDFTEIKVKEGIVKISNINNYNKEKIIAVLEKGDSLKVNQKGKIFVNKKIQPKYIASWKEEYLYFSKTSIIDAIKEFSRYNNYKTTFDKYENTLHEIDGKFPIKEFDKFLYALEKIYPIKIKKEKKNISISSK